MVDLDGQRRAERGHLLQVHAAVAHQQQLQPLVDADDALDLHERPDLVDLVGPGDELGRAVRRGVRAEERAQVRDARLAALDDAVNDTFVLDDGGRHEAGEHRSAHRQPQQVAQAGGIVPSLRQDQGRPLATVAVAPCTS